MPESTFFEERRRSPTAIAVVILLHGAALTALMLAKGEAIHRIIKDPPLIIKTIRPDKPPPENHPKTHQPPPTAIPRVPPIVPIRPLEQPHWTPQPGPTFPTGPTVAGGPPVPQPTVDPAPQPKPEPIRDPVRSDAVMLASSDLQPPYPAAAQREGAEGIVVVSVLIGADGRVKAVEKVSATRDDFFRAAEAQALRHWRFKPAMVDGRPVESRKVVRLRFQLSGEA
jgi:protein TonB